MHFKFLIIPSALICQMAVAQTGTASLTLTQAEPVPAAPVTPPAPTEPASSAESAESAGSGQVAILDYKSVYEAATVEEEVKMATERFSLTQAQQEMWLNAATDRRVAEKSAHEKLDSKTANYERDGAYRGLRTAHNLFHETIIGYLSPTQKSALDADRAILNEKNRRMAKLPPPPPPAPTVTVAPVDSAAIKETEKPKAAKKKKKKKAVMQ